MLSLFRSKDADAKLEGRLCEHPYVSRHRAVQVGFEAPRRRYVCLDPNCRKPLYFSLAEVLQRYAQMPGREKEWWFVRRDLVDGW